MRGIGEKIRAKRKRLGWTIQKLATLAEIDRGFLSKLETGKASGSWETYEKISGAMGLSVDVLFPNQSNVAMAGQDFRIIPVLDYVQAGSWTGVIPNAEGEMRETVMAELEHPPSTFAMRIRGDSMEPEFKAGDLVVINPTIPPEPGDYVVATNGDGEANFKQYRNAGLNERGEAVFELLPLNPLYAPMRSDRQPLAVVGVMVEHRKYRRHRR